MSIPASHWAEIKALFDALAELSPPQRESCIADSALNAAALAELRSLLANHDQAQSFLAMPAASPLEDDAPRTGLRMGAWEIVRAVGVGGMGEVFEAKRADGSFEGRAAVKLLKRGMDSAAVLHRFAQERQALARLNHPHIARLLDAGASVDGLPYFVLEYVDGQPLDQAVQGIPVQARLNLFLQLADAVAYAHRNLLVHRDLKPGNVLVDRDGQVKLLDFGIAKALDPLEGHDGQTTVGGHRPFTPNYASPEQVRGEPVTTATDIYSLGVLLYQMLTGTRPTGRNATTPAEAARSVLEDAPTKPSRLSPQEALDPQWLQTRKVLEGDLDNILLKALEKASERRYSSVEALAEDVRRYLDGFPVSARPASWSYHFSRRIARNRLASAAIALGLLALVVGSTGIAWQAHEARQAQQLAEMRLKEVRRVTHELVFGFGDSVEYLPGGMKIKSDLFKETLAALERLVPTLGGDEAALADIAQVHVRLAEAYAPGYPTSLNQPALARFHAEKALALVEQVWPGQKNDVNFSGYASRAYAAMASTEMDIGNKQKAVTLNRRGLELAQQALDAAPPGSDVLRLRGAVTAGHVALAIVLDDNGVGLGQHEEAMKRYQAARSSAITELDMTKEMAALDAKGRPGQTRYVAELEQTLAVINGSMSSSKLRRGDYEGATASRREAVAYIRKAQAKHPEQVQMQAALHSSLRQQAGLELQIGQPAASLKTLQEAMEWNERLLATDRKNAEWLDDREFSTLSLGTALSRLGRNAEAVPWLHRSVDYWRAEQAKSDTPREQRTLAIAEFRWYRAQALLGGSSAAAAWQAAGTSADRLRALADANPESPDGWLMRAEAENCLATDGPAPDRAKWQTRACGSWREAEMRRVLPPFALPMQAATCGSGQ
jgi:serine/threonine protein kinase